MSHDKRSVQQTPIIKLWDVLVVPLQGEVSDSQAQLLTDEVLLRIQRSAPRGMVIDVSGMWLVDSHLCSVLARLATSAKLMGTRTVVSGMSSDVALTLQAMGMELRGIESTLGLEEAMELLHGQSLGPMRQDQSAADEEMIRSLLGHQDQHTSRSRE